MTEPQESDSERGGFLSVLKCLFTGHKHRRMRAVDRESDTWQRLEDGEVVENIDGCTILEECVRCSHERRMSASVETAKRMGIPLEWNRSVDTGTPQSGGDS